MNHVMDHSFLSAIEDLERRGIMPLRVPSLEPTRLALARFDLHFPEDARRVIVVAGTNGKGSTSKTLEALLRHAGCSTGFYSSPHLVDYRERIRVDGENISEELFARAWSEVAGRTTDLFLSHFEMLTVMAAWIFFSGAARPPVEYAVFEVGLGGVWDATNALPHATAVICRLGLDHQEFLGDTIVEIARNKFGIVTPNSTVVHLPIPMEAEALRAEVERATGSRWVAASSHALEVVGGATASDGNGGMSLPRFFLKSRWGRAEISLPGQRGAENMNLALEVFASLGFDPSAHLEALSGVIWPARMQRVAHDEMRCPLFISGDHNIQGVESLLDLLRFYRYETLYLLIGIGEKKDLDPMMEKFASLPRSRIHLTTATFRGRSRERYGVWLKRAEGFFANPMEGLDAIAGVAGPSDLCLVTGSLYLAGDVLVALSKERMERTTLQQLQVVLGHWNIADTLAAYGSIVSRDLEKVSPYE